MSKWLGISVVVILLDQVTKYLADIQRPSRNQRDFSKIALWVSNYAQKIERIPTEDVDSDLVAYAQQVAYRLRDAVANIHGTAQQAAQTASQIRDNSQVTFGAVPTWRRVNFGGFRMREYAPMSGNSRRFKSRNGPIWSSMPSIRSFFPRSL